MFSLILLRIFLSIFPSFDLSKLEHNYAVDGICFEWTTTGVDAPGWSLDSDADGHPDFLDSLRRDFSDATRILRDSFQLPVLPLDRNNPTCSLHVAIVDLESVRIAEGARALGAVTGHPTEGYAMLVLENNFDPSGTAPKINSSPYPSNGYRGVVFHEMMHLYTPALAQANHPSTGVFTEQIAQWFTATRSGAVDGHILTDTTDDFPNSLFDPAYRYSNWFWLEDLETRKGTPAILDWIRYRSAAAVGLPPEWNQLREDSLLTQWFRTRKEYVQTWQSSFVSALTLLVNKFPSPTMPHATVAIQGHARTPISRPISLDTRGRSERIVKLPPLSWVTVEQPQSWVKKGAQTLTVRVDPPRSQAYAYGSGLEAQPSQGGWVPQNYNLYGISDDADTLKPSTGVAGRHILFMSGPDSTTLHLTAHGEDDVCRARPVSFSKPDLGGLEALDDGNILTWIDPVGDSSFILDLGADVPLAGIELLWRDPQSFLNTFDVDISSEEHPTWDNFQFPISFNFTTSWSINFSTGFARWIRFNPTMTTTSTRRLSEIAIWTKGDVCLDQNQTSAIRPSLQRAVEATIKPAPGRIVLEVTEPGRLEWRTLDGSLLGTEFRDPGTWNIPSPKHGVLLLAIWTSEKSRTVARVPSVR